MIQELQREWFRHSIQHLLYCEDENCELFWAFQHFLTENNVPVKLQGRWKEIVQATPDHADFGKRLTMAA